MAHLDLGSDGWPRSLRYRDDPAAPELGTKVGGYALETMMALANRVPEDREL